MTKSGVFGIMSPEGRCYIQIGGWLTVWTPERIFLRGEVMRMWKRRLFAVLRFLALCAVWAWILTTEVC